MTAYTYTLSPPSTDTTENIRLGYRTPRSILLPPYLALNPYFVDFMDAVDAVFETNVDIPTEILGDLRNMWVSNPNIENNYVETAQLIPFSAWSQPEWEILVQQVNMLGMKFSTASVLTNDNYQSIARWVGQYWFGKGTSAFIDFINYCLSSSLQIEQLWTEDYENFYPTGSSEIGTPLWEGGTWYPTPNVSITATGGLQSLDVQTLTSFFYEIANYNIVLQNIAITLDLDISTEIGGTDAPVVALGLNAVEIVPISNLYSFGADSPPQTEGSRLPVNAYTTTPSMTSLPGVYMLAAPSSWLQDTTGRLFPLYDTSLQSPQTLTEIPTTLCGTSSQTSSDILIYGPVQWQAVPSGNYSTGRFPVFSSTPVPITTPIPEVTAKIVGSSDYLLVNPVGFVELVVGSGLYVPFWNAASVEYLVQLQSGGNLQLLSGGLLEFEYPSGQS